MADIFARMRQIIGSITEWASNDIVLGDGEVAFERVSSTLVRAKVGDGTLPFSQAPYLGNPDVGVTNLTAAGYVNKLWSYKMPSGGSYSSAIGPVTLGGAACLVFSALNGWVYGLRISDGALVWSYNIGTENYGRCQAEDVDSDGLTEVFVGSHDGKIYCLNEEGTIKWQFSNLYNREATGTSTSFVGNTLTDSGKAWSANAFVRADGVGFGASLRFTSGPASGQSREITVSPGGTTLTVASAFSPVPSAGGGDTYVIDPKYVSDLYFQHAGTLVNESGVWYLYVGGFDNHFYKLNANTGAIVWKFATLENIEPYPLVVEVGGVLRCYGVSVDGYTRCFRASDGVLLWATATGRCDAFIHCVDVDNDGALELTVSSRDGRVYILDAAAGAIKHVSTTTRAWDYGDIDCAAQPIKLPTEATTRVLTGGDSGTFWCFDYQANTLWQRHLLPNVLNSSPLAHDVEGNARPKVLIGDSRGVIHCVDITTGAPFGSFYTKGVIEGIPLYGDIDGDGKAEFVVVTNDGYVECFRFTQGSVWASSGTPGASQWRGRQYV